MTALLLEIRKVLWARSAMTRRTELFYIAAIHFPTRSEAVIDPRVLGFSAWQAGVQRLPSLKMPPASGLSGRFRSGPAAPPLKLQAAWARLKPT
jgi:hypothetical protein